MNRLLTILVLMAALGTRGVLSGQTLPAPPYTSQGVAPSVAGWTAGGAGAGFGLGFYLGFLAFDQATYAERKIMTAAVVGAAAGALGGYLVGRLRHNRGPGRPPTLPAGVNAPRAWLPVSGSFTLRGGLETGPETMVGVHHGVK